MENRDAAARSRLRQRRPCRRKLFPKNFRTRILKRFPSKSPLDPEKLAEQPLQGTTVAVFGSSHSSMIALPHLLRHPVESVINFYQSPLKIRYLP